MSAQLILAISLILVSGASPSCQEVRWTGGESINWPCAVSRQLLRNSDAFVSKNVLATRLAVYEDRAYVAMPRFKPGIPITLGKIRLKGNRVCEAVVSAFPSWSMQEEGSCGALQSAVDIFQDSEDVLWVLDSGIVQTVHDPLKKCPPKIVAIDLDTEKVIKKIDLSPVATCGARLQFIIAEYGPDGRPYVYIADGSNRAILVYDVTAARGTQVLLPEEVAPAKSHPEDVLYMHLIRDDEGNASLIFSYWSAESVFSLDTSYLRDGTADASQVVDLGVKQGKRVFLGTDNGSGIFFRKEGQSDVYRWDVLDNDLAKVYKGGKSEYPTHVVPDYRQDQMRVLLSNFHDYFDNKVGCGANHQLDAF